MPDWPGQDAHVPYHASLGSSSGALNRACGDDDIATESAHKPILRGFARLSDEFYDSDSCITFQF